MRLDLDYMDAELRSLSDAALWERTLSLLRISYDHSDKGLDRLDRAWRERLEQAWCDRGRRERFAEACEAINRERREGKR